MELAEKDRRIAAVTAAMMEGTGLTPFRDRFPDRFFDVGIAEQHAVTFAAGLALARWKLDRDGGFGAALTATTTTGFLLGSCRRIIGGFRHLCGGTHAVATGNRLLATA